MHQTLLSTRPCPISDSREITVVTDKDRDGNPLQNVISQDSGLIFVDPIPFDDITEFYKEKYRKVYKSILIPKKKHIYRNGLIALQRYEIIQKYLCGNDSVLDIGSSGGEFLYLLKCKQISAIGVEPNELYAQFCMKEFSVNVQSGMFSDIEFSSQFNIITLFHVFEHLENPLQCLNQIVELLVDEGYLFIEVPNIVHHGISFHNKWHKGHLYGYTEKTLNAIASKAGLQTIFCEPVGDGGNVIGIFQKREHPSKLSVDLHGHASDNLKKLEEIKTRYYLSPKTYTKPVLKLIRNIQEISNSIIVNSPKAILDRLYNK